MPDSKDFRDFTEHLADRMQAKREDEKLKTQKALHDTSILKQGFDALGEQTVKTVEAICDSINNNPNVGVRLIYTPSGRGAEIGRVDVADKLRIRLNPDKRTAEFDVSQGIPYSKSYCPKLDATGTGYYFIDDAGASTTVEEMCKRAIEAYLGLSH